MFCNNCGAQIQNGAGFCNSCGAAVAAQKEDMPPVQKRQVYTPPRPVPRPPVQPPQKPPQGKQPSGNKTVRTVIIICAAVLLLGLLILGAIAFFNFRKISTKQAYEKYADIISNSQAAVEKYAKETNQKNVALYDVNNSGVPDMIFMSRETKDGETVDVEHIVFDDGNDVSETTYKPDSDMVFVIYQRNDDKTLWHCTCQKGYEEAAYKSRITGIDKNGTRSDDKIESFEKEEAPVTVVICTMPDDIKNKLLPNIEDDVSLTYEEAIETLKNGEASEPAQSSAASKTDYKADSKTGSEAAGSETESPETTAPAEETTAPLSAESYIEYYAEGTYSNKIRNSEESYALPLIALDSADASAINEKLRAEYDTCLSHFSQYETEPYFDGIYTVSYEVWLNGSILSLSVTEKYPAGGERHPVYNIDVSTGKEVDNSGIAEHYGTTLDAIRENIRSAIDTAYNEKFSGYVNTSGERYKKTVSDENVAAARLFIGENDKLYVMYDWYMEVQAGQGQAIGEVSLD